MIHMRTGVFSYGETYIQNVLILVKYIEHYYATGLRGSFIRYLQMSIYMRIGVFSYRETCSENLHALVGLHILHYVTGLRGRRGVLL